MHFHLLLMLERRGLQGVKEWGRLRKQQKWNRVQEDKVSIDVDFKFLKIVIIRESRKRKKVPQARSVRKETVRVKVTVTFT